jgi:hypothetical protein
MTNAYKEDLAYIHDAGFGGMATNATPVLLDALRRRGLDWGTAQIAAFSCSKRFDGSLGRRATGAAVPSSVCGERDGLRKRRSAIFLHTYGPRKSVHSMVEYGPR